MFKRHLQEELKNLAKLFKAIAVIGPRQSGKTTIVRAVFPDKTYLSLENPDIRRFVQEDPRGFLNTYKDGAIIDEAQRVPELFSYLQQVLDEDQTKGKFILTGSNNFLLQENISQSLAGRVGYAFLLPFTQSELQEAEVAPDSVDKSMFIGSYPPIYDQQIPPQKWYQNYIRTYVERDVRLLRNIADLGTFERFIRLCAGRCGQLLNMNSLAVEAGVDHKTISAWISVLESSFLIFLLKPHHQNFNKRLVKMPKLYFYDTGLVCSLLGLQHAEQLNQYPLRGELFENYIISELVKENLHQGLANHFYFWRDHTGNEIDLIIDDAGKLYPVEIKSGQTINQDYFKGLNFWRKLSGNTLGSLIYGGDLLQKRSNGIQVYPWNKLDNIHQTTIKGNKI